ncbi:LysR family transcriptional regulator, partial [Enhygromyxa salina]|uniref:LysR family transcriptional regulator n=1 Tax=Enhygromyxa salina TaxID=215803 RepID=UPI00215912FC
MQKSQVMVFDPPDSDERLFLRIVEAGSLKAAAEQLGTDPSAVSRRLAALEARLGQQLLRRSTRGSRPTEVGARYYEGLAQIVAQQDALEAALASATDEAQGRLRVTAPPEFGVRFVVPVLESLQREHSKLSVELALGTGFYDLASEDIDVAIRIGTLRDSALRSRRLGRVPRVLVASPGYLRDHGEPSTAAELPAHCFLGYRSSTGVNILRMKTPDGQAREVELRPRFTVNSVVTLVRLVESGQGVLLGPLWAFADSIAAGRVRALLSDHRFDAYPVQALYRGRRYLPAKTRVFIDAMVERVAAEASLE